jgi:hypothetical protein
MAAGHTPVGHNTEHHSSNGLLLFHIGIALHIGRVKPSEHSIKPDSIATSMGKDDIYCNTIDVISFFESNTVS